MRHALPVGLQTLLGATHTNRELLSVKYPTEELLSHFFSEDYLICPAFLQPSEHCANWTLGPRGRVCVCAQVFHLTGLCPECVCVCVFRFLM